MKHCFQAVNGECAASFTPLDLKWLQLVDWAGSECSVTRQCVFFNQIPVSDLQNESRKLSSAPSVFIYFSVKAQRDSLFNLFSTSLRCTTETFV